jgi:hypothetical protein
MVGPYFQILEYIMGAIASPPPIPLICCYALYSSRYDGWMEFSTTSLKAIKGKFFQMMERTGSLS